MILAVGIGFGILAVSTGYGAVWLYGVGAMHAAIDGEARTASPWSTTHVFLDDVGVGGGALGALK